LWRDLRFLSKNSHFAIRKNFIPLSKNFKSIQQKSFHALIHPFTNIQGDSKVTPYFKILTVYSNSVICFSIVYSFFYLEGMNGTNLIRRVPEIPGKEFKKK